MMETRKITQLLVWSIYIYMGFSAIVLLSTSITNSFITSALEGSYSYDLMMAEAERHDLRDLILSVFYIIANIFCIIFFLRWTYKSSQISHLSGAKNLKFSPGWSVGWYFIPIALLWKPYQAFKQIYQVSIQINDWKNVSIPSSLRWWWGLFITSGIINNILIRLYLNIGMEDGAYDFRSTFILEVIVTISELVCCLIIIQIVKEISQRYNSNEFQAVLAGKPPEESSSEEPTEKESTTETSVESSSTETTNVYFDNRRSSPKKSSSEEPVEKESTGESAPDEGSTEETDLYFDNRKRK